MSLATTCSPRPRSGALALLTVVALLATGATQLTSFVISGRLENDLGCYHVTSGGKGYELLFRNVAVPPAGSLVTLEVRRSTSEVSTCMVGEIVEVERVLGVVAAPRPAPSRPRAADGAGPAAVAQH